MNQTQRTADPCVMVIFGATGDLTKRKLFPALYNLAKDGFLPENFAVIGVGRQELETDDFRHQIIADLKEFVEAPDKKLIEWFEERTYYTGGDFDDDKKLFTDIKDLLGEVCQKHDIPENFFYYLATPPQLFANVAGKIHKNGLSKEEDGHWRRLFSRNRSGATSNRRKNSTANSAKFSMSDRFTALTIISERNRPEHSRFSIRQQHLSSRFGIAIYRPRANTVPKNSASRRAAAITTRRARCAI
jgi:hypothetical protein